MNKNTLTRKGYFCPFCGRETHREELICSGCYNREYIPEAGKVLAQNGKFLPIEEWVKTKATSSLRTLHSDIEKRKTEYSALQNDVRMLAIKAITESLGGQSIPKEIIDAAIKEKSNIIWQSKGGNNLFRELKILEKRWVSIQSLIGKLKTAATPVKEPVTTN
jgi:hypothetical protein